MPASTEYSFGPFRLIPDRRLLMELGQPVRIGGRALDLLTLLVERAGQLVDRDELIEFAWPTTIVEATSLRVHVATLRKLLGEGQDGARYIANISGRGYSFIAEVQRHAQASEPPGAAPVPRAPAEAAQHHNLPVRLTRMVGRSEMVHELARRLPVHRLITIVGAGGMGKSTLALTIAEQMLPAYPHGVWFIDLSVLNDPALLATAVAAALGMGADTGDALPQVLAYLQHRRSLLVLDNCEHLVDGVAHLAEELLAGARGLNLLVTSREALRAQGERIQHLPALPAPEPGEAGSAAAALDYPAVQLFVERAIASMDSFELTDADGEAVAEICRRLDGMPFAIELAAARVDTFGVRGLLSQLHDRFPLLSHARRGVHDRHRTLRALLDWSHDMLGATEQVVLRRLAIFVGSFDQDAVCRVLGSGESTDIGLMEHIAVLAERSLVTVDSSESTIQYRLLDTTRLYALEKLRDSDDDSHTRRRHADYLSWRLSRSQSDWVCLPRAALIKGYPRFVDEVRAALDWSFGPGGDLAAGMRLLVAAAGPLAHLVAPPDEFLNRVQAALDLLPALPQPDPLLEYRLWSALATLSLLVRGHNPHADAAFARAHQLGQPLGLNDVELELLNARFVGFFGGGNYAEALRVSDEFTAAPAIGPEESIRLAGQRVRALCLHFLGRHAELVPLARRVAQHPSPVIRVGGTYPYDRRVSMRIMLARSHWMQGRPDTAMELALEAQSFAEVEVAHAMSHVLAWALCPIALWNGQLDIAAAHTQTLIDHSLQHRRGYWKGWGDGFQRVLALRGRGGEATEGPFTQEVTALQNAKIWDMLVTLEPTLLVPNTVARVEQGLVGWCAPEVWRACGELALRAGDAEPVAEAHFTRAMEVAASQEAFAWELRAACSLARLRLAQGRRSEVAALLEPRLTRLVENRQIADVRQARQLLQA